LVQKTIHGTVSSYTLGKCRCTTCKLEWKLYMREYRAGRAKKSN
jgi:hypothetical protein